MHSSLIAWILRAIPFGTIIMYLFVLSPNDLVYLPTEDEVKNGTINRPLDKMRIYKMVSCTGTEFYYIPFIVASPIVDKGEFFSLNKIGIAITGEMIKEICIPIKVDRLGNIPR